MPRNMYNKHFCKQLVDYCVNELSCQISYYDGDKTKLHYAEHYICQVSIGKIVIFEDFFDKTHKCWEFKRHCFDYDNPEVDLVDMTNLLSNCIKRLAKDIEYAEEYSLLKLINSL